METRIATVPNYAFGCYGPKESEKLLSEDGLNWWNNL